MDDPTTSGAPTPDAVPTPPPADSPPAASSAEAASASPAPADIRCDQCGKEVPNLTWCVRCGDPLGPEQRRGREGRVRDAYAAAPGERASAVRLVSTLYPSLPREEIRTFQMALVGGAILVVALGLLGFFPVAIVAAAILVPLVTVIYVYDVDVYEDEPIRVIALTFLWGALVGALFSYALDQFVPTQAASVVGGSVTGAGTTDFPWVRGVIAPLLAVLLMAAGPLALLPYKRFNDVLDGATFGVASGVAFVGAQTFITALNLFDSGLRPVGDIGPWIVRLLVLGVAMPVVAAGAIGGLCGVMWLRYRAPVGDRGALGPLGHPAVAALIAAALMLVASLSVLLLPDLGHLILVTLLAILGLIWLRRIIHVGLLEEASEIAIGPAITCPECGKQTPLHTYCGNCGTSLKALPKSRGKASAAAVSGDLVAPHEELPTLPADVGTSPAAGAAVTVATGRATDAATTATPAGHGWLSQRVLLTLFAVVMLGAVAIAAASAFITTQGQNKPDCPDKTLPCSGAAAIGVTTTTMSRTQDQAQGSLPFADRTKYHDDALGFGLEFDPTIWTISQQDAGFLILTAGNGAVALIIEGGPADQFDPQAIFDARESLLKDRLLAYTTDDDQARALLGTPILGYRPGVGGLFGGTLDTSQGPSTDFSVASVAATDGQITMVATMLAPVEIRDIALSVADSVVNSFTWPADEVPQ